MQSVSVSAWPAVKLLWRQADTVRVRAGSLSLTLAQAAQLIHEARGLHEVTLSASRLTLSSLMLSGLRLHKRGSLLQASGVSSQADAKALLPPGLGLLLPVEHRRADQGARRRASYQRGAVRPARTGGSARRPAAGQAGRQAAAPIARGSADRAVLEP